jgi:2-haloacid dehalogenase
VGEQVQIATFDCYGTLIDWEGGAGSFLYQKALRVGDSDPPPGPELRERWEAIQFELVRGDYRPYKEILAESVRLFCDERGWPYEDEDGEAIVRAIRSWQAFPDTRPALGRCRDAGLRLMIVSNTDRDIIDHSVRQIGVQFDDIQVAEDVGAYKPADEVFAKALERIGEPPDRVLHVAFGFKYDIGPAGRAGMQTAWVNRYAEPPPSSAPYDHEWRDLWGLASLAESL